MDTIEIFKLFGSIMVDNAKANESIQKTEEKAGGLASKLGGGIKTAAKWGLALGAAATGAGVAMLGVANKAAETTDRIDKLSQKIGMSREAFQEWDFITSQSGMSVEQLQMGFKTLVTQVDQAVKGAGKGAESFQKLGVSVTDANGAVKSQEVIFEEAVIALQHMEDGTEKAKLANDLFGRSGAELMPLLNGAAGSVEEMKEKAHELGLVLSDDAVDAGVKFTDTMDQLKRSFGAVFTQVGTALMPIFIKLSEWIMDHMPEIKEVTAKVFETISVAVSTTYGWFKDNLLPVLTDLFGWVQDHMPQIKAVVGTVFGAIIDIGTQLWKIFQDNLLPILKALWDFISPTFPLISAVVETTFGAVVKVVKTVVDVFDKVTSAIKTAIDWLTFWNDEDVEDKTPKTTNNTRRGHASGLPFVPYDGYKAELHRGEAVLNSNNTSDLLNVVKALAENAGTSGNGAQTINLTIELDGKVLARQLFNPLQNEGRVRGRVLAGGTI